MGKSGPEAAELPTRGRVPPSRSAKAAEAADAKAAVAVANRASFEGVVGAVAGAVVEEAAAAAVVASSNS